MLLLLFFLSPPLGGQAPARLLREVQQAWHTWSHRYDPASLRASDHLLGRLELLAQAPPKLREQAVAFLKKVAGGPGGDLFFRIRVRAVGLLVDLSDDTQTIAFLLKLARRQGDASLEGLDTFIVRALARIRQAPQVRFLVRHLADSRLEMVRLCLEALARQEDDNLVWLALPQVPRIVHLALAGKPAQRVPALLLLGRLPAKEALRPLVQGARDSQGIVRLAAASALRGKVPRRGVVELLELLLEDPLPRVRETAMESLARGGAQASVPLLVARLAHETLRLQASLARSLKRLTGQDFGPDARRWKEWLQEGGKEHAQPRDPFAGQKPVYGPRYYGIPVASDRLLFVLDISGSMAFHPPGTKSPSRLQRAKRELIRTLLALSPATRFNILVFSWSTALFSHKGLVPATKTRRQKAIRFVERQQAGGGTNTFEALRLAFHAFPTMDTLYLLSDGSPTVGSPVVPEKILYRVQRWNLLRGVRIHCIGLLQGRPSAPSWDPLDDREDARRFLQLLAHETGGLFVQPP